MSDIRCPHCRTELPEKATFCGACGRRIEGWRAPDAAAPADATALPGSDEATRQMAPTPSLLRAAALSLKKGGGASKRPRLPLLVAMLVVAAGGGVAGFLVVRGRLAARAKPTADRRPPAVPEKTAAAAAPAPVAPPPAAAPAPEPQRPTPIVRRNKAGKRAHVIASAPVAVAPPQRKHRRVVGGSGGLPHKTVATDSKSITQQQKQQQRAAAAPAAPPPPEHAEGPPPNSQILADNIRFVVRAHLPQVRACYGRAFKDSSPGGTVEIGFAIDGSGRARNVRTETNTTDSEMLAHCLEQRVREWQFPRPPGGDFELIYPFVFAPGS